MCVACVEEGIELREAGITSPILVLGCSEASSADYLVHYALAATLCDMNFARALSSSSEKLGTAASVHIKVDTGMGRIGVAPEEALGFAKGLMALAGLNVNGVFTHFPTSDESDRSFTLSRSARSKKL